MWLVLRCSAMASRDGTLTTYRWYTALLASGSNGATTPIATAGASNSLPRRSAALCGPRIEVAQLHAQQPRLNRIETAIVPLEIVVVLLHLPVIPQHSHGPRDRRIVGCHGTAFPARAEVLARVEAECGSSANRPGATP